MLSTTKIGQAAQSWAVFYAAGKKCRIKIEHGLYPGVQISTTAEDPQHFCAQPMILLDKNGEAKKSPRPRVKFCGL